MKTTGSILAWNFEWNKNSGPTTCSHRITRIFTYVDPIKINRSSTTLFLALPKPPAPNSKKNTFFNSDSTSRRKPRFQTHRQTSSIDRRTQKIASSFVHFAAPWASARHTKLLQGRGGSDPFVITNQWSSWRVYTLLTEKKSEIPKKLVLSCKDGCVITPSTCISWIWSFHFLSYVCFRKHSIYWDVLLKTWKRVRKPD